MRLIKNNLNLNLKLFKCIGLFLLVSSSLLAQRDFVDGMVVTNSNDTLKGLINFNTNDKNSSSCVFKKSVTEAEVTYSALDLKTYRLTMLNKQYFSKEIVFQKEKKTVFLEILVDGIVDLYSYNNGSTKTYYLEKENEILELDNSKVEIVKDEGKYSKKSNKYKNTLTYLFRNNPEIFENIKSTNYDDKSLSAITSNYHNLVCKEYACVVYTKKLKTAVHFEPFIGMVNSILSFDEIVSKNFDFKPIAGFNLRFSDPSRFFRWSFSTGLSYAYFNTKAYSGIKLVRNGFWVSDEYYVSHEYGILRIPLRVEYAFSSKRLQPFLALGLNGGLIVNTTEKAEFTDENRSYSPSWDERGLMSKLHLGVVAGVGLRYKVNKKFDFFTRAEYELRVPALASNAKEENYLVHGIISQIGLSFKIK